MCFSEEVNTKTQFIQDGDCLLRLFAGLSFAAATAVLLILLHHNSSLRYLEANCGRIRGGTSNDGMEKYMAE